MSEFFHSGRVVDLILGLVVIEALLLLVHRRRTGAGVAFARLAPTLLSGGALLLAVRFALVDAEWQWVAASLSLALLAHLLDLRARWLRPGTAVPGRCRAGAANAKRFESTATRASNRRLVPIRPGPGGVGG